MIFLLNSFCFLHRSSPPPRHWRSCKEKEDNDISTCAVPSCRSGMLMCSRCTQRRMCVTVHTCLLHTIPAILKEMFVRGVLRYDHVCVPTATALVGAGALSAYSFAAALKTNEGARSTSSTASEISAPTTHEAHECDCMPLWCEKIFANMRLHTYAYIQTCINTYWYIYVYIYINIYWYI